MWPIGIHSSTTDGASADDTTSDSGISGDAEDEDVDESTEQVDQEGTVSELEFYTVPDDQGIFSEVHIIPSSSTGNECNVRE